MKELRTCFGEMWERRRQAPGDDMVSELTRARVEGEELSRDEGVAFCALLLVGGIESAHPRAAGAAGLGLP